MSLNPAAWEKKIRNRFAGMADRIRLTNIEPAYFIVVNTGSELAIAIGCDGISDDRIENAAEAFRHALGMAEGLLDAD